MKYYVRSQDFEVVIGGDYIGNPRDAACEAFLRHYTEGTKVSPITIVSERGFDYTTHEHEEDHTFDTCEILKKAGFKFEDE